MQQTVLRIVDLKKIDLSSCKKLKKALIGVSWITTLDLSHCPEMEELICKGGFQDKEGLNFIREIDLSNCTKLKKLECVNLYELKNLDISNCTELESLDIMRHNLREIDISNNRKLKRFYCLPLRDNYELTVYVWPGFEGIADNDYEDAGVVSNKVNIVVAD